MQNSFLFNVKNKGRKNASVELIRYLGNDKDVIIPSVLQNLPVKSIAQDCFAGSIVETVSGSSIAKISRGSFAFAFELREANFPNLEEIGSGDSEFGVFYKTKLETFNLGPKVKKIYPLAFSDSELEKITSQGILYPVLNDCLYERDILIWAPRTKHINAEYASEISDYVFQNSNIESIYMPNCVCIGVSAFANSKINISEFPSSLREIKDGAFSECKKLTSLKFSVPCKIGQKTFWRCSNLKDVNFKTFSAVPRRAFAQCYNLKTFSGVIEETIGEYAFSGCTRLMSVDTSQVQRIGASAFAAARNIKTLDCRNTQAIRNNAFAGMSALRHVVLGSDMYEYSAGNVSISAGLKGISSNVFLEFV